MKKIVSLGLAAALASGMVFAAEPAANPSVVSFTGNASVEWGVDLDAGKTGFKNSQEAALKVKLFDGGDKVTEQDGDIWAELKIVADTKETELKNEAEGAVQFKGAKVDTAKFHLYNFYVGIQSGDTLVGEFKPAVAINGDKAWLSNVGGSVVTGVTTYTPAKAATGAVLEAVDAAKATDIATAGTFYKIADGVYVDNTGKLWKVKTPAAAKADESYGAKITTDDKHAYTQGIVAGYDDSNLNVAVDLRSLAFGQYTDSYAMAAEVGLKDSNEWVSGLDVKLGGAVNLATAYWSDSSKVTADNKDNSNVGKKTETWSNLFGYTAQAGYKFNIDDKFYVKPMVGYTGQFLNVDNTEAKTKATATTGKVVGSVILGWGAQADANAGVPYLDGDSAKKVTPGLSVAVEIPLAATFTTTANSETTTYTYNDVCLAKIVPSFYLGDLVPNLKAGAYAEITALRAYNEKPLSGDAKNATYTACVGKNDNTIGLAVACGVAYDIKADAVTVTPKAGIRYANDKADKSGIFADMGIGGKTPNATDHQQWFNLKLGCDVAGLINNTTFYVNYASCNLLNDNDYADVHNQCYYSIKAGTLNVGTKISF